MCIYQTDTSPHPLTPTPLQKHSAFTGDAGDAGDMLWIVRHHARRNIANDDELAMALRRNKRVQVCSSAKWYS